MPDVVEIAKERRVRLAAEIGKLEDFIRMAEALMKHHQMKPSKALNMDDDSLSESSETETVLSVPASINSGRTDAKA